MKLKKSIFSYLIAYLLGILGSFFLLKLYGEILSLDNFEDAKFKNSELIPWLLMSLEFFIAAVIAVPITCFVLFKVFQLSNLSIVITAIIGNLLIFFIILTGGKGQASTGFIISQTINILIIITLYFVMYVFNEKLSSYNKSL